MELITLLLGFALGIYSYYLFSLYSNHKKLKDLKKEYKSVFTELENSIGTKSLQFINRVNYNAVFKLETQKFGNFDLVIFLDKNEIHFMRDQKMVYTSTNGLIDQEFVENLISKVNHTYKDMNDIISLGGNIIDKKTISQMTRKLEIKKDIKEYNEINEETSELELTLDDILDKINEVGLDGLTKEELNFLNNHSK